MKAIYQCDESIRHSKWCVDNGELMSYYRKKGGVFSQETSYMELFFLCFIFLYMKFRTANHQIVFQFLFWDV